MERNKVGCDKRSVVRTQPLLVCLHPLPMRGNEQQVCSYFATNLEQAPSSANEHLKMCHFSLYLSR